MLKLLIVDDEYLIRRGLQTVVDWKLLGYEVVGLAENGEEGLDQAVAKRPDVIMTDIRMPFIDGLKMLEKIREKGIDSKVIILSGFGEFAYAQTAIKFGVYEYVLKPVNRTELIQVMTKLKDEYSHQQISHLLAKQKVMNDLIMVLRKVRGQKSHNSHRLVEEAKRIINQHVDLEITVKWLADKLYISSYYIMHIFKEHTGQTVTDYVTNGKIQKAKRMIESGEYKMYEICEAIGYKDYRYFSRVFRKYTGQSPREYMKYSLFSGAEQGEDQL